MMKLLISYRVLSYARVSSTKDLLNRQTYQGIFCVSTLSPHTHVIEMLVLFCFCPSALQLDGSLPSSFLFCYLLSYLGFRLVLSCRLSVGPSPGHIIGLIVPANSNLVPSGLGLRPERMLIFASFFVSFFSSFSSLFPFSLFPVLVPFFCPSFQSFVFGVGIYTIYHGYVPVLISLQVIRDDIPRLAIVSFPLRTGTAVLLLFCLFSSIETLFVFCSLFCDHGLDFREVS